MELKTFDEWSRLGYKINKGSKSFGKTSAGFMFNREQVSYIGSRYKGQYYAHDSREPFDDPCAEEAYDRIWGGY